MAAGICFAHTLADKVGIARPISILSFFYQFHISFLKNFH